MGLGAKVGTAYVDIEGDFSPLEKQIQALRAPFAAKAKGIGDSFSKGIGPGLDETSRKTKATGKDFDVLGAHAARLDGALGLAGARSKLLGRNLDLIKPAALITGLGLVAQGASAVGGAAVAAVAALAPLTGLAAAAGAGLTAAAQGAGTFALAAWGLGDALKEQMSAQTAVAAGAGQSASAQRSAARAIQSAEDGVADAKDRVRQAGVALAAAHRGELSAEQDLTDSKRDAKAAELELVNARRQAARNLEDLQSTVADAILNEARATQTLQAARRELANLEAGASSEDLAAAHDRVTDSVLNETRATQALQDAQQALADLLAGPSAEDQAGAHERVADAQRAQERAALDLKKQQQETDAVLADATATDDEKARARLDLADAEDRVTDAATASTKAQKDLQTVESGPDPKKVERARSDVAEAEQRVVEAREASTKAQSDLAKLEAGPTEQDLAAARLSVAEAEKAAADAIRDRARDQADLNAAQKKGVDGSDQVVSALEDITDANRRVKDAEQGVADARRAATDAEHDLTKAHRDVARAVQQVADAQAAAAESNTGAVTGATNLNKAFNDLPPAAQAFVRQLVALKPKLDDLRATAAAGLFPGASEGLAAAVKNFGPVKTIVAETSGVLGDLARRAGELVGSKGFGQDLQTVGHRNATIIATVGDGALHAADALRHIVVAAGPLTSWLARLVDGWAGTLDAEAKAGRESGRLAGFFDKTREVVERLVSIGGNLVTVFFNVGKAATPLGNSILEALDKASGRLATWTKSVEGQNTLKKYFDDIKPAVFEVGRLASDAAKVFLRLGAGDQVAPLLHQIRTQLLPVFEKVVASTTSAFGPHFINLVTQVAKLFGHLAGSNGPLTAYVDLLAAAAGALAKLLDNNPQLQAAVISFGGMLTVFKALKFASMISGLSSVSKLLINTGGAYRALAGGATAASVAETRGTAATIAAKAATLATAAATRVATAAKLAWNTVTGVEAGLITATTLALIRQRAATVASSIATKAAVAAQWLLNAALTANPIGLAVAAVAALAAGFIYAYNKIGPFHDAVDAVIDALGGLVSWVGEHWQTILAVLTGPIGLAVLAIKSHVDDIVGFFKDMPDRVASAIRSGASAFAGAVSWIKEQIVGGIRGLLTPLVEAGKWILNRIVGGITTITDLLAGVGGWIKNRVSDLIHAEIDGLKTIGSWLLNRIVDGFKAVTDVLSSVGGWIRNRISDLIHAEIDGLTTIGSWILNRIVGGITTITDLLAGVGGWIKNRVVELIHDAGDGFEKLGSWVIDKIVAGLKGGANLFVDFVNDLIDIINKIPGVDIGHVKKLATGGSLGREAANTPGFQGFWQGGKVTAPMAIVGEEAPQHPEFVIPTNPAYRQRALGLFAQTGHELGIPGYALGGVIGEKISDVVSAPLDLVKGGAGWLIDKLPKPARLPDWLKGLGSYAIDKVTGWIKDKVSGLLSTVTGRGGGASKGPDGLSTFAGVRVAEWVGQALRHAQSKIPFQLRPTSGFRAQAEQDAIRARDPRAAVVSEHTGTKYPHGAVDFGGFVDPAAKAIKMMVVNATKDFKYPLLAPAGFSDDGHASGTGHARGGVLFTGPKKTITAPFVGSFKTGGVVPQDGLAYVHAGETITSADGEPQFFVDVHVDDPTLKDLVRVEIRRNDQAKAATFRAGVTG